MPTLFTLFGNASGEILKGKSIPNDEGYERNLVFCRSNCVTGSLRCAFHKSKVQKTPLHPAFG
jgi:hypothetical protein